eukprot:m.260805 g.260805  ORF g.260805 m.260805 type:complete len:227 (-) comp40668_c0_seq1:103-783(-)
MASLDEKNPRICVKHVDGDLLRATEQYIVHQCNCTSKSGRGIAKTIFQQWPHADVYRERAQKGVTHSLGTIVVRGGTAGRRGVINLFGQHSPGKPRPTGSDTPASRLKAFENCLEEMKDIVGLESVAFPFQIGSGLAGGHWPSYEKAINKFATDVNDFGIRVSIYKLPVVFDNSKKEYVATNSSNSHTNSNGSNTSHTNSKGNTNQGGRRKPKNPTDVADFFKPRK